MMIKPGSFFAFSFMLSWLSLAWGQEKGLVAYYPFDEGGGRVAHDQSGNHHDGKIVGCLHVKSDRGFALDVGGMGPGQYVNCGDIDISGELTICAWVLAYTWNKDWGGLVYKADTSYGIRNCANEPGKIHFRAGGRDLISNSILQFQTWYHLAAVFKPEQYMRFYINGVLDKEIKEHIPAQIGSDNESLRIGASGTNYFKGRIDEVRIYDRALSGREIEEVFEAEGGPKAKRFGRDAVIAQPLFTVTQGPAVLKVFPRGGMELVSNGESYRFTSVLSARGKHRNHLSLRASPKQEEEVSWQPSVTKAGRKSIRIVAQGGGYRLNRTVTVGPDRIQVRDAYTNVSDEGIGIIIWHRCILPAALTEWYLFGVEKATSPPDPRTPAINPTCFLSQEKGGIGLVVEDDVFRNQLEAVVSAPFGSVSVGTRHFGLPRGKSYTTSLTIYLSSDDYFGFLNDVRRDWGVNHVTVPGPASFLRAASWSSGFYREEMAPNPDKFRTFLKRKNIKVFLVCPWYKYWDGFDYTDDDFKKTMEGVIQTVKAVQPDAKLLACLETYYYFVPRSVLGDTVPQKWEEWSKMPYQFSLPTAATRIINRTPWKDSVYRNPVGNVVVSRGDPGPDKNYKTPPLCLNVYPEIGNYFFKLRMQEINFVLEKVGFDGVYMDMFGYGGGNYTFGKWDGHTVDIDAQGRITRKYADLALLTAPARQKWLEAILGKGKIALVNFGSPNTRGLQRVGYLSFVEGAGIGHRDLESPIPDASGAAGCQLSTPIALGGGHVDQDPRIALARVRAYLRYGVLYYHYYARSLFAEQGESSGEYGPINHMFPITPITLHKGWIEGKERIITTVSGSYLWKQHRSPRILLFDEVGRQKEHSFKVGKAEDGWRIEIRLRDWKEMAVVEEH